MSTNSHLAVLIRKFAAGVRLTDAEMVELEGILPRRVLLKHGRRLRGRDVYDHPRGYYAKLYGTTPRSINNWIKHGLQKNEPPPLDSPTALIGWWGKYMVHKVPDRIYEAARKVSASPAVLHGTPPPLPEAVAASPTLFDPPPASVTHSNGDGLHTGFLASLLRTRQEEANAHQRYVEAVAADPPNEGNVRVAQKIWQELASHLRALEKAAPEVLQKSGDMWLRVDVVNELAHLHGVIVSGVRSLGRRFAMKAGIEWTAERDRLYQAECDFIFRALVESKFSAHD